jgi:hypothetical protein
VTRVVGVALGAQIAGAILGAGPNLPPESAFTTGFVIAGLTTALSLLIIRVMKKGTQS